MSHSATVSGSSGASSTTSYGRARSLEARGGQDPRRPGPGRRRRTGPARRRPAAVAAARRGARRRASPRPATGWRRRRGRRSRPAARRGAGAPDRGAPGDRVGEQHQRHPGVRRVERRHRERPARSRCRRRGNADPGGVRPGTGPGRRTPWTSARSTPTRPRRTAAASSADGAAAAAADVEDPLARRVASHVQRGGAQRPADLVLPVGVPDPARRRACPERRVAGPQGGGVGHQNGISAAAGREDLEPAALPASKPSDCAARPAARMSRSELEPVERRLVLPDVDDPPALLGRAGRRGRAGPAGGPGRGASRPAGTRPR